MSMPIRKTGFAILAGFLLALALLPPRLLGAVPSAAMWGAIVSVAVGLGLGYHRGTAILVPVGALAMVAATYLSVALARLGGVGWCVSGLVFGLVVGFTIDLIERQTVRRHPPVAQGSL